MRRHVVLLLFGTFAAWATEVVAAEPAYQAAQIVDLFAPKAGADDNTRSVCVGTEKECGPKGVATEDRPTFDLKVTFDLNSIALSGADKENLDQFATALKDDRLRNLAFRVEGHTDARGSAEFNLALSKRRADAVVHYLTEQGVPPSQLKPVGLGKSRPKLPDPFDPANRRVETRVAQ
jgi:outer membrane protein OmpA-like peptidoglycan-associated protein